jgi:dethiobiotin synthetase
VRRIIVVGTGTAVGKSYVSCALLRALRRADPAARLAGVKPIESGVGLDRATTDAGQLEAASFGLTPPSPHPLFAFPEPLSPHLAARRAGAPPITISAIRRWLAEWEATVTSHVMSCHEWCIVETAGALLSPLAPRVTNFDLAVELEPATWVLVAPDALGALHDVSVTLEALSARGRPPDHLVLSASRVDASTGTNADELRSLGIATPTAVLGRDGEGLDELASDLVRAAHAAAEGPAGAA